MPPPYPKPTLDGFVAYLRNEVGLSSDVIPDSDYHLSWAFDLARANVPMMLLRCSTLLYLRATYLFAVDRLVRITPDTVDITSDNPTALGPFGTIRAKFGVNAGGLGGIITAASDNGTSASRAIPDWIKTMTLSDLQLMQTPWGQEYLSIIQDIGPVWGMS